MKVKNNAGQWLENSSNEGRDGHDERDGREAFLNRIAARLGRIRRRMDDVTPLTFSSNPWESFYEGKTQEDLVELFCQTLQSQGGKVWRVPSVEELRSRLHSWLTEKRVKRVMMWDDPRLEKLALASLLEELAIEWLAWQRKDEGREHRGEGHTEQEQGETKAGATNDERKWVDQAEQAQVGITWADGVYAETGTVVVCSGPGKGRSVSLLPDTHLVFLYRSQIQGRLSDLTRQLRRLVGRGELPSSVNLIGGPSSSADIQMQIVKGVHGPRELVAVVLDWDEEHQDKKDMGE